jgi:hypothetical protein
MSLCMCSCSHTLITYTKLCRTVRRKTSRLVPTRSLLQISAATIYYVGFGVFVMVVIKSSIFWKIKPYIRLKSTDISEEHIASKQETSVKQSESFLRCSSETSYGFRRIMWRYIPEIWIHQVSWLIFHASTQSLQATVWILPSNCLFPNASRPIMTIYCIFIVYLTTLSIAHIMPI